MLYGGGCFALAVLFFAGAALSFTRNDRDSAASTAWVGVFFLSTGGGFCMWARQRANVQRAILQSGVATEAVITAIKDISFSKYREWFREVTYRYDALGRMHKGKSGLLTSAETRGWTVGDKADIKFDAAHPARSAWVGRQTGIQPALAQSPPSLFALAKRAPAFCFECLFGIVVTTVGSLAFFASDALDRQSLVELVGLLLAGGFVLLVAVRKLTAWRRLLKNGISAEAVVTAVTSPLFPNVLMGRGGITEWQCVIYYTYTDAAGRGHEGNSGYVSRLEASGWKAGDKGGIRIGRDAPNTSIWIGRMGRSHA